MTRSENVPELDSSPDWCYFDTPSSNYDHYVPDYIFMVDITQSVPTVVKMISMTKFDGFGTAEQ